MERAVNFARVRFQEVAQPASYITVDEASIKFFGRKLDTISMRYKPAKCGFMILALASNDGFIHDFLLSSSKQGFEQVRSEDGTVTTVRRHTSIFPPTKGAAYILLERMKSRYPGARYTVFFDNLFLDVPIAKALRDINIGVCGTTRKNAPGIPSPILAIYHKYHKLLTYNDLAVAIADGDVLCFTWKDNNMVTVITTSYAATDKTTKTRKRLGGSSTFATAARK